MWYIINKNADIHVKYADLVFVFRLIVSHFDCILYTITKTAKRYSKMKTIKQLRTIKNISQKELSERLGVSRSAISMWETGASKPDFNNVSKVAEFFNVSVDYLLGRDVYSDAPQSTEDGKRIPVLGTITMGIPIRAVKSILDWEEISIDLASSSELFALKIKDCSMEPRFVQGDVVIVKQQADVDNGDVAVVIIGNDTSIRRIYKEQEGIMLIPSNLSFKPEYFSNKEVNAIPVKILGKIVELRAKF